MRIETEIDLTPEQAAVWFWSRGSDEQADFLEALAKHIQADASPRAVTYGYGEMQWCYLRDELRKPGRELANSMHMAFSAFAYDFVEQKREGCRDGVSTW